MDITLTAGKLLFFASTLLVVLAQSITEKPKYCAGKPADLVFVMDSSGSIGDTDFLQQKEFIKGMVELFETDTGKIRVGVVSYSNWAFLEFNLNRYNDKKSINGAIDRVRHYRGDTNTGSAITYMRDVMFHEHNGARDGVPHIAIVLTDGRSNDPWLTIGEAKAAREENIAIFAIGVGHDISESELKNIASEPTDKFVFQVSDYVALQYIKEMLAIKACEVPAPPRKYPTTTTEAPELACRDTHLADIVYAVAPSASAEGTDKALAFFREITNSLDISNDKIRIGMVPKDCGELPEVFIRNDDNKMSILNELDKLIGQEPTTFSVLKYMRRKSFSVKSGGRKDAKRIGLMFVDEGDDLIKTKHEARKAKDAANIEMYVIAIGRNVNKKKLRYIASEPLEDHLFMVPTYDHLPPILELVKNSVCPAP